MRTWTSSRCPVTFCPSDRSGRRGRCKLDGSSSRECDGRDCACKSSRNFGTTEPSPGTANISVNRCKYEQPATEKVQCTQPLVNILYIYKYMYMSIIYHGTCNFASSPGIKIYSSSWGIDGKHLGKSATQTLLPRRLKLLGNTKRIHLAVAIAKSAISLISVKSYLIITSPTVFSQASNVASILCAYVYCLFYIIGITRYLGTIDHENDWLKKTRLCESQFEARYLKFTLQSMQHFTETHIICRINTGQYLRTWTVNSRKNSTQHFVFRLL